MHLLDLKCDFVFRVVSLMFQIVFIELAKFAKELKKIDDILELWLYLIKNAQYLGAVDREILLLIGRY